MFLRPTIVRTTEDARAVTELKYGYISDSQKKAKTKLSLDDMMQDVMGVPVGTGVTLQMIQLTPNAPNTDAQGISDMLPYAFARDYGLALSPEKKGLCLNLVAGC